MPRWQKNLHRFSFGLVYLLLGGMALYQFRYSPFASGARGTKAEVLFNCLMIAIAAVGLGTQEWFRRRERLASPRGLARLSLQIPRRDQDLSAVQRFE